MKTKILSLLFFFFSVISFSQTLEELKMDTEKFYDANYYMEFEYIVSLTYPAIIESIGEDEMLNKLELDYENEEYRMRLQLVNPVFQYSNIKNIEEKIFCVITYKNPVRYFYEDKLDSNMVSEKIANLKEKDNTTLIVFEPKRNSFSVNRNSKFLAVYDETTQNKWKFFNFDDAIQKQLFRTYFNETTKKELGL